MAGTEDRCGAVPGEKRLVGGTHSSVFVGLAVAVTVLARFSSASAQEAPEAPGGLAPPGGLGGLPTLPTVPTVPGLPTVPGVPTIPGAPEVPGAPGAPQGPGAPGGEFGPPAVQPPAPQAEGGRPYTVLAAVNGTETFTDNVFSTATNRQADVYTNLNPSLFITGQGTRLSGTFDYSPEALIYAHATNQDQILQNLFGSGTVAPVPGLFAFDGNASINNASRFGAQGFNNQAVVPTSQSTQSIAYSGSPYLQGHYGDWGDSEVRYTLAQTMFNGNTGPLTSTVTGQNLGTLSNSTQQDATARFVTGPRFARLQLTTLFDYNTFNSGNSTIDSRDTRALVNGIYQVSDFWAALFGGGYEKLTFPQQSFLDFTGPNWDIGARYQSRPDRSISLTYGESQGFKSVGGNVNYAITSSTTFSGSYSVSTSTQQQQALTGLSITTETTAAPGTPVNSTTGLQQFIINPNFSLQDNVIRVKSLIAGLVVAAGQRNTVTLTADHIEENGLSTGAITSSTSGGTIGLNRDLAPLTIGTAALGYASNSSSGGGVAGTINTGTLTGTLLLNYSFTPTLTGTAGYSITRQTGGLTGTILVDLVSFTLRKTF